MDNTNLLTIFVTGLLTGGLSCIAIQGGFMTASLAQYKLSKINLLEKEKNQNIFPVMLFLISRIVAYAIFGFVLGWVGSALQINIQTRIIMQFAVVIFMLGTALSLLRVHPIFDYFVIIPPRFITNIAYGSSEGNNMLTPVLLGFLTVLIPCGATQAIMALAVSSGSPLIGAIILFVFILGTSPLFFVLGLATLKIGSVARQSFLKIAAVFLILLSFYNLDATLALADSPHTIRSIINKGYCIVSYCSEEFRADPVTEQTITFSPTGYTPNHFIVRKGSVVTLHLVNQNATGCIQAFTVSALNIQKIVLPNNSDDVVFNAPQKIGKITFTCSAGFYPGTIEVI